MRLQSLNLSEYIRTDYGCCATKQEQLSCSNKVSSVGTNFSMPRCSLGGREPDNCMLHVKWVTSFENASSTSRQCCDLLSTRPACDERDGGEQKSMMSESSICYSSFVVASRSLVPNVRIHFLRISFILDILLDLLVVLPCGRVRPQGGG